MSHSTEDPNHRITSSLLKTLPCAGLTLVTHSIKLHTVMRQLSLLLSQPSSGKREIREDKVAGNSNHKSDGTLEDEEPLPASKASDVIKTVEDTSGDETSESSGQDVSGIQDGDAGCNLLAGVEDGEEIDGAGVVGGFGETEEEAGEEETLEVLCDGSEGADDGPEHHHDTLRC